MNVILVGSGTYDDPSWVSLNESRSLMSRLRDHATAVWNAAVDDETAVGNWSAATLRPALRDRLAAVEPGSDLLLVWSGHGQRANGHWLVTYDTPGVNNGVVSTANALGTEELSQWLLGCPARHIVVILDTCWAGDGGAELANAVGEAAAANREREDTRSLVVISSARREQARDGAFLSAVLSVLVHGMPPDLASEHRWDPEASAITAAQLCAAVNPALVRFKHQAQLRIAYGVPGAFFRLVPAAGRALPAEHVARLFRTCPELPTDQQPWTARRLAHERTRLGSSADSSRARWQLDRTEAALRAWDWLDRTVATDQLGNALTSAWRAMLPTMCTTSRPRTRFGYIEAVALHFGGSESNAKLIELMVRTMIAAKATEAWQRLYEWAGESMCVDAAIVDDARDRATTRAAPARLVVDFSMSIEADGTAEALPTTVKGFVVVGPTSDPLPEIPYDETGGVPDAIGKLLAQAWDRCEIGHIDVVLPGGLMLWAAPERAELQRRRRVNRVIDRHTFTLHWSDRLEDRWLRSDDVISRAGDIAARDKAVRWYDPEAYASGREFVADVTSDAHGSESAVAFTGPPADLMLLEDALAERPYVLWVDRSPDTGASVRAEVEARWLEFPGCLIEAQRTRPTPAEGGPSPTSGMQNVHAIWDDPDWLENVVPLISRSEHRARL